MALGQRRRLIKETFRGDCKELSFVGGAILIEQRGLSYFRFPNESLVFFGHHIMPTLGLSSILQRRRPVDNSVKEIELVGEFVDN